MQLDVGDGVVAEPNHLRSSPLLPTLGYTLPYNTGREGLIISVPPLFYPPWGIPYPTTQVEKV